MAERAARPGPSTLVTARPSGVDRVRPRLRQHAGLVIPLVAVGVELVVLALTSDLPAIGRLAGTALVMVATAGLIAGSVHERGAVRGAAAVTAGVLGTAAGAGIAPVHLVTTGPSLIVAIAAVSLVSGLVLLAAGTWLLVRATPGWWRLLAIPVAFLVLQFVLLPLGAAVYGTHPPRTPTDSAPPPGAQSVSFVTPDGVTIAGWYTPSRNGAAVVVLPGSGGEKASVGAHAAVLARHGYGTLALDSRGAGDSGGIGNAWGWHGPADVAGALTWLATQPEVDATRVAVLGLSMGGEEALTAAAMDLRIAAVVAEGATARTTEDLAYLPWDASGVIQRIDAWVMYTVADVMTDAPPPARLVDAVAATTARAPVLLVVGNDPAEPAAAAAFTAAAPTLQVWSLPDTPHIQALGMHPDAWEARVIDFLDAALRGG